MTYDECQIEECRQGGSDKMGKLVEIEEHESVAIIKSGMLFAAPFGPGWVGAWWFKDEPMPTTVREVFRLRGLLNENMEGLGI